MTGWTVKTAQTQFSVQQDNEDMAIVDAENKSAAHWFRRWQYLVERGCPKLIAYDTIAARARKSRKTIQNIVRVHQYFDAADIEQYEQAGITYMMAAVTREEPERFLDEALRHPDTNLETLLVEFLAADPEEHEPHPKPPYRPFLWGAARRVAILPVLDRQEAVSHLAALEAIFERNNVE